MLHAEVVANLVRYGRRHDGHDLTVVHGNATRKLVRANRTLQRLTHDPAVELLARQQLRVVVGERFDEGLPTVVEEILQRFVAVTGQLHLVVLAPHDDADQGDEDVQRRVHRINDIRYRLAVVVDASQAAVHRLVQLVVHDQDQLHERRVPVRIVWASDLGLVT